MSSESPQVEEVLSGDMLNAIANENEGQFRQLVRVSGEAGNDATADVLEVVGVQCAIHQIWTTQTFIISNLRMPIAEGGLRELAPRHQIATYLHNFDESVEKLGLPARDISNEAERSGAKRQRIGLLRGVEAGLIFAHLRMDRGVLISQLPSVDNMVIAARALHGEHEAKLAEVYYKAVRGRREKLSNALLGFTTDLQLLQATTLIPGQQ